MRFLARLAFAVACVAALGCGPGGTPISGEVVNNPDKAVAGEKWSITLTDGDKTASGETDEKGAFTIDKVPAGTYSVRVMHYVPAENGKAASRPQERDYADKWVVPGGPYKLDLSKSSAVKGDPGAPPAKGGPPTPGKKKN